jgi:glycosyltransferase involved in cell wall biosynthesis
LVVPNGAQHIALKHPLWRLQQMLLGQSNRIRGAWRAAKLVRSLLEPKTILDAYYGYEDYRYPGTWKILDLPAQVPDIVHLHNLHGDYFDLRALPWLSNRAPIIVTLHDMWMLTGFCIYSFECERWHPGCTDCPLLHSRPSIIPSLWRRDGTRHNWNQKREIFERTRLSVVAPSNWLMKKARQSILGPAMISHSVIPYGIDLSIFRPGDRLKARETLGIAPSRPVLLVVAAAILKNVIKGFPFIRESIVQLAAKRKESNMLMIAVGAVAPPVHMENLEIRFVPFTNNPGDLSAFYRASDIYLHGAIQDNFPNTVLEALACGIPVVGTAVGGIPEQVKSLQVSNSSSNGICDTGGSGLDQSTGILVPYGNSDAMARAVGWMLDHEAARHQLGENAAADARRRFGLERQLDSYLEFYEFTKEHWQSEIKQG